MDAIDSLYTPFMHMAMKHQLHFLGSLKKRLNSLVVLNMKDVAVPFKEEKWMVTKYHRWESVRFQIFF